jgi:hypothetical protein
MIYSGSGKKFRIQTDRIRLRIRQKVSDPTGSDSGSGSTTPVSTHHTQIKCLMATSGFILFLSYSFISMVAQYTVNLGLVSIKYKSPYWTYIIVFFLFFCRASLILFLFYSSHFLSYFPAFSIFCLSASRTSRTPGLLHYSSATVFSSLNIYTVFNGPLSLISEILLFFVYFLAG